MAEDWIYITGAEAIQRYRIGHEDLLEAIDRGLVPFVAPRRPLVPPLGEYALQLAAAQIEAKKARIRAKAESRARAQRQRQSLIADRLQAYFGPYPQDDTRTEQKRLIQYAKETNDNAVALALNSLCFVQAELKEHLQAMYPGSLAAGAGTDATATTKATRKRTAGRPKDYKGITATKTACRELMAERLERKDGPITRAQWERDARRKAGQDFHLAACNAFYDENRQALAQKTA